MHYTDLHAQNLFARLFTYAPRSAQDGKTEKHSRRRNALEDFCTEALAWCLANSKPFAERLFSLECFADHGFRPESFQANTQLSFTNQKSESEETPVSIIRSRFDLVLTSASPSKIIVVIECKVAPDKGENIIAQIATYKSHLNGAAFNGYTCKLTVLLTPYFEKHNADSHLSWDQVYDALCDSKGDPQETVLIQFAEFLKMRHLSKMKLPATTTLLPSLKKIAPFLVGLDAILESLRNDTIGKSIFGKNDVRPKMGVDTANGENYLWYGIWSRGARPTYIIGFHTTCDGNDPLLVSIQVTLDGDRTSEVPPKQLMEWFNKGDSGREGETTNFIFTHPIEGAFDGNTAAIEGWLIGQLSEIHTWLENI